MKYYEIISVYVSVKEGKIKKLVLLKKKKKKKNNQTTLMQIAFGKITNVIISFACLFARGRLM